MSLRKRIEDNVVVWLLGTLLTGFLAGITCYRAILEIAHLEVVPATSVEAGLPPATESQATDGGANEARNETRPYSHEDEDADDPRSKEGPAEPTRVSRVRNITFEYGGCAQERACLLCDVIAENHSVDRAVVAQASRYSRVIDPTGAEYFASRVEVGQNLFMTDRTEKLLVRNVPSRIRMEFCGFEEQVNYLSLVEYVFKEGFEELRVQFRDVKVG